MNTKKLAITVVVVFILLIITNFLIHNVLLSSVYMKPEIAKAFRSMDEMMRMMWRLWVADLVWSFFFVFLFTKGYENKGIMEGIRYGIYIGLFMNFIASVAQNVTYHIPFYLALQWFIYGLIQSVILGIAAAITYKPKPAAAQA